MKKHLGKIVAGVAILLGLVAVLLIFAPAIAPKKELAELAGDDSALAGSSVAFGNKNDNTAFSAYVLAFALPLVGVILAIIALLGKGGKVVPIIAAVCFVVGGIFYFLPMALCQPNIPKELSGVISDKSAYVKAMRDALKETCTVGLGAIFGGILSILAGCASVATLFVKKK